MKAIYWDEDDQGLTFEEAEIPTELLDLADGARENTWLKRQPKPMMN